MKNSFNSITFAVTMALVLVFALPAMATNASDAGNINGNDDGVSAPIVPVITPVQPEIANGSDDGIASPVSPIQPAAPVADVRNGDDDTHTAAVVPTPENPGGGGGGGGGTPEVIANRTSSGGSSNGGSSVITLITPGITITSCPLLTSYLKLGAANDGAQVTKLQVFLKNVEKLDVNVNGIFDQKTDDAVRAFQIKYLPQILGPWEATRSTGFVYITTLKKINELACASPLTLSADELAIIEAYKNRANGTEQEVGIGQAEGTTPTASSTIEVGSGTSTSANIAAVGEASILSRFWDYIKNLFK